MGAGSFNLLRSFALDGIFQNVQMCLSLRAKQQTCSGWWALVAMNFIFAYDLGMSKNPN